MNANNKNQISPDTGNLKDEIKAALDKPAELEKLYRGNKVAFKKAFDQVFPDISANPVAQFWKERLNFEQTDISWGSKSDLTFVIVTSIIAGLIAKIPDFTGIDPDNFFSRNIAFVVFPFLSAYFARSEKIKARILLVLSTVFILSVAFINNLPQDEHSDTLILACIHLPLFLWSLTGFAFLGGQWNNTDGRLLYLKYNGDLLVMTGIIIISGGLLSGLTMGLFELIEIHIEEFYRKNIIVWGLAAAPLVGTYLVRTNPQLVNKVSPVIAKVFTPLVFATLLIYLITIIYTGKDPYNDREFLLIFNALLIGVMAIIFFSISENSKNAYSRLWTTLLFSLSLVTLVLNGIALSAILFRISEWGFTPNRLAVLGSNLLMLANLSLITYRLFKTIRNSDEMDGVGMSIASFLPLYSLWTVIVAFIFPLLFDFK